MNRMYNGRKEAIVYTDGACSVNNGIGGWAYMIMCDGDTIRCSGSNKEKTTGNEMELRSVCEALDKCTTLGVDIVRVYSDSAYVVNSINSFNIFYWHRNKWKKKNGKEIKNRYYWERLYNILLSGKIHIIDFEKVKAHSGNKFNTEVNFLAKGAKNYVYSRKNS